MSKKHSRRMLILAATLMSLSLGTYQFFWHGLAIVVLPSQPPPVFTPAPVPEGTLWQEARFLKLTARLPADWSVRVTGKDRKGLVMCPPPSRGAIAFMSQNTVEEATRSSRGYEDDPGRWDLYEFDRRDVTASRAGISLGTSREEAAWLVRKTRPLPLSGVAEGESESVRWLIGVEPKHANGVAYSKDGRWRLQLVATDFPSPYEAAMWLHAVCGRLKFDP